MVAQRLLTSAEVASVLRDMADRVESGDSLDGSIEYIASETRHKLFEVRGAYRTGNSEGRGGMRIVGGSDV